MDKFYTVFFIRKSDNKVLKRFQSGPFNKFFWKKEVETQLSKVLSLYDLDKKDIIVREYDGAYYE